LLPIQTHVPYRPEYTSARLDHGGRLNDPLVSVRGCFVWLASTKIPACRLKRSPGKDSYFPFLLIFFL
jgi:hypothetical protein